MVAVQSFAPLAARLAARADEIRPAAGAEVSVANFMALFFCVILHMLIALCEALDARAAADARLAAAPALRESAARADHATMPAARRAPRLAPVSDVQAVPLKFDAALSGMAAPAYGGPWLAWSRHPGPAWAVAGRIAIPPKSAGLRPRIKHAYIVAISI